MSVSFLTDDQQQRYGRYAGDPTPEQLARYFHLDEADRELIARCRADHRRLGFALQLCPVRFLGTFLEDPLETPLGAIHHVASQLGLVSPAGFAQDCTSEQPGEHATEIRLRYRYQDFAERAVQFRLHRWLYALCWTGTGRPSILFDRSTAWLITHKVLLPGASVLERLVARVRTRVQERLWRVLVRGLTPESRARLDTLLTIPEGQRRS